MDAVLSRGVYLPGSAACGRPRKMDRQKAISELPLLERDRELSRLVQAALAGTPALLTGSPGSGRTRLLHELSARLASEKINSLYVPFVQPLHAFLLSMAARLSLDTPKNSSVALRGLLWKAFEDHPRVILLDDIAGATLPFYRFFEKLLCIPGVTIIGAAVHVHRIGALERIFWNHQSIISLRPLTPQAAFLLARQATELFAPDLASDAIFQQRVVQAARGNPGRIVEMCSRVAEPAYRDGARIRFAALSIDSLTRLLP